MAQGIKLTDSINISELMHMREVEGLSNAQIAKKLDCHISTVYSLIGKQPAEMTKRNHQSGMRKVKELPPLTDNKVVEVDQPKMSFAERCEAARVKAEKKLIEAIKEEPVFKKLKEAAADIPAGEPKEADKAREAHCKELGKAAPEEIHPDPTPCRLEDIAREAYHRKEMRKVSDSADSIVPVIVHGTVYDIPKVAYEMIKHETLKNAAPAKEMESARAAGDKMAVFRKTGNPVDIPHDATLGEISEAYFGRPAFDTRAHVNELLAVFGTDVVRQYLRVALYALGIPDCRQVRREHLLDALNTLNKEATCND